MTENPENGKDLGAESNSLLTEIDRRRKQRKWRRVVLSLALAAPVLSAAFFIFRGASEEATVEATGKDVATSIVKTTLARVVDETVKKAVDARVPNSPSDDRISKLQVAVDKSNQNTALAGKRLGESVVSLKEQLAELGRVTKSAQDAALARASAIESLSRQTNAAVSELTHSVGSARSSLAILESKQDTFAVQMAELAAFRVASANREQKLQADLTDTNARIVKLQHQVDGLAKRVGAVESRGFFTILWDSVAHPGTKQPDSSPKE
jgi:hypothetical protein